MTKIKICGITNLDDALTAAAEGADAIGINLVPGTPRYVVREEALGLARVLRERAPELLVVAVIVDLPLSEMIALQSHFGCLQLHGKEPPEQLLPLLPHAYKAVRIAGPEDVALATNYPGEHLLVDTKVKGVPGGSGTVFDWTLVRELVRTRKVTLAGGLDPSNVRRAISTVRPYALYGIDVASGVELVGNPRKKDVLRIRDFLREAKAAYD